ncbi:glutaredoxin family protein [Saccharopolyspora gloriosae]|uniref:glutaredoxin family protein n=1 Tax=Saccharopolyspora gloriosae TaxID=455344 RepID=UPI001FB76825|nr:glutaredoxin family protein [Saccharopolyspora gloriosae]
MSESGRAVTLLVREQCHLCEVALAEVREVCGELDVPWSTEDVDADPEQRAEYGDRVPVILVDGVEHGYWKVEPDRLRAALAR